MNVTNQSQPTTMESIQLESSRLVEEVTRIIHEGNVRRIVVKQGEQTIVEFPLAVGVVGTLLAAPLAALGALAVLLNDYTIEVEREEPAPAEPAVGQHDAAPAGVAPADKQDGAELAPAGGPSVGDHPDDQPVNSSSGVAPAGMQPDTVPTSFEPTVDQLAAEPSSATLA